MDLQRKCTGEYPAVFQSLEDDGHLDTENHIDMFCLHWCYLPQLEAALHQFQIEWNSHRLSSEGILSPNYIAVQSWLAAKEAGISLDLVPEGGSGILDDEDPKVVEAAATNFVAYGTEARLAKDPGPSGPDVEVIRPVHLLPFETAELLKHPLLLARLDLVLGPAWPVGDDLGTKRFLRCKETVQEWLDHHRKATPSSPYQYCKQASGCQVAQVYIPRFDE